MKSAVIFGGCGFIGLYFAEKALDINLFDNLYLVDIREPEDSVGKLKYQRLLDTGKVKFLKRDVRENLNDILIEKNLTTILNFAAIHREPGHQAYEYGETNISGAKNVCDFAKFNNCKNIIFTSSIAVYGPGEHEKNESTEAKPSTPYGKSKLESEKVHLIWQKEDPDNIPFDVNNCIHFVYEMTSTKQFKLYAVRGSSDLTDIDNFPFITIPSTDPWVQTHDSYGRMMPVHFILRANGSGEFRVDTGKIQFNINSMPGVDASEFRFNTGCKFDPDACPVTIRGLSSSKHTTPAQFGMVKPLTMLANLAVNSVDNSDNLDDIGVPPFIAGIPLTPIRRDTQHQSTDNERPKEVIDQHKQSTGTDAWLAYSYSGDLIDYINPLESIVDGQDYDIRGVASTELSASLDVVLDYEHVKTRFTQPGNSINAVSIEGINISVENAAVFGSTPDENSLVVSLDTDNNTNWTTKWTKVNNLSTDSDLDSHVMFLNKTDTFTSSLTGWELNDFNSEVILKAMAVETKDIV